MHLNILSVKWRWSCLGLNMLKHLFVPFNTEIAANLCKSLDSDHITWGRFSRKKPFSSVPILITKIFIFIMDIHTTGKDSLYIETHCVLQFGHLHKCDSLTNLLSYLIGRNNTLRPIQNGGHFPDNIFKCILLNENVRISIKNSLKFVPKGPINNIPTLVQTMARARRQAIVWTNELLYNGWLCICGCQGSFYHGNGNILTLWWWLNYEKQLFWCKFSFVKSHL